MFNYYYNEQQSTFCNINLIMFRSSAMDLLVTADIGLNMLNMMCGYVICKHGIFATNVFVSSFVLVDTLVDADTPGVLQ